MGKSEHDKIAESLAEKEGVEYNQGKGPDVKSKKRVIEVATHDSDIDESTKQVIRYQKPKYLATPKRKVPKAIDSTRGTGIGVMDDKGKIIKRSRGKGKRR